MDKLHTLIAIEAIELLKSQYIRYIDTKNWKKMLEVWAPETFDVRAGRQLDAESKEIGDDKLVRERLVSGRHAIMVLMRAFAPPGMVSVHIG